MEYKDKNGLTEAEFLKQFAGQQNDKPSVAVDVLLFTIDKEMKNIKVLLVKKQDHPFMNSWLLPGGFIGSNESTFVAANRLLKSKAGLADVYLEQLYTYSNPKRDPRMRVLAVAYMGIIPMSEAAPGDPTKDIAWFNLEMNGNMLELTNESRKTRIVYELEDKIFESGLITYDNVVPKLKSDEKLGFDHVLMIIDGVKRIRNKIEYTDVAFNFVNEEFTLPDLQRVYELILGHPLYKKNFRDKILDKITKTEREARSVIGNRMSAVYAYKKKEKNDGGKL